MTRLDVRRAHLLFDIIKQLLTDKYSNEFNGIQITHDMRTGVDVFKYKIIDADLDEYARSIRILIAPDYKLRADISSDITF